MPVSRLLPILPALRPLSVAVRCLRAWLATPVRQGRSPARPGLLLAVLLSLACFPARADRLELPQGISLELPAGWEYTPAFRAAASTGGPAMRKPAEPGRVSLLLAKAPEPLGAMVQISLRSEEEALAHQRILAKASPALLDEIQAAYLGPLSEHLIRSGLPLLRMHPLSLDRVSGLPALVVAFSREGSTGDGPWEIVQYKIPVQGCLVEATLGWRAADPEPAREDLDLILSSLQISRQPELSGDLAEALAAAEPRPPQGEGPSQDASPIPALQARPGQPEPLPSTATPAAAPALLAPPRAPERQLAAQNGPPLALEARPSFDCQRAATPVEQALCADAGLADLDRELAALYRSALSSGQPVREAQMEWLLHRDAVCGQDPVKACLDLIYRDRIGQLRALP